MSVFHQVVRPDQGVAWITGASSGVGAATASALASRGWTVHITARREAALTALAAEAPGLIPAPGDVMDRARMQQIVTEITAERPLALAILNAGVYTPMTAEAFDAAAAQRMFDVNLTGVANGIAPALQTMIAQGFGHLALNASVAGYRGLPKAGPYSATKAGLIAMAESLAMDLLDKGVRLSVINHGFVETEATAVNDFEMAFLMSPDEAARRIVRGLERPGFEIAFPRRFALILRAIGLLPNRAYIRLWRRLT